MMFAKVHAREPNLLSQHGLVNEVAMTTCMRSSVPSDRIGDQITKAEQSKGGHFVERRVDDMAP